MYGTLTTPRHRNTRLFAKTPIGYIEVPQWEETEIIELSDIEVLERALTEHYDFCVSPATYAMVEKRLLAHELQKLINPSIGMRHVGSNF